MKKNIFKRLGIDKAGTAVVDVLHKAHALPEAPADAAKQLPSNMPDPRVASDIASFLLTHFPESYAIADLEQQVRECLAADAKRPAVPFLAALDLIEHAYEEATPGADAKHLREDAAKAFAVYEGAALFREILENEKFQLVLLQEHLAEEIGRELLKRQSARSVASLIDNTTADSIVRGIVVEHGELYFEQAEAKFLQLPPEWLRLVSETLALLVESLFRELARTDSEAHASALVQSRVKDLGIQLKSLPAFHSLLRTLPAGVVGAGYLESMSRAELEREVRRRTEELSKKTRELEALVGENARLAAFPENNPSPILEARGDGTLSYINPAAKLLCDTLRLPSAEAILPANHAAMLADSMESGEVRRSEVSIGDQTFEWLYAPFPTYNSVHLYAQEVSDKKRIEAMLTESQQTALLLVKKEQEAVDANRHLTKLTEELSGVGRELVKRDLALSEANAHLTELDQMKSEFVSVAAHQLRTPLTGIRWTLQALADKEFGEITAKQEQFARTALKTVVGAVSLINDLLSVARMEEGRLGYVMKPHDIVATTRRSILRFMPIAGDKGVQLIAAIEAAPPEVKFDEEKIEMCIDNLIDNAIKYTESGGKVVVGMTADDHNVRIAISDTGVGIPEPEQYKIFSKFYRAHNAQLLHTAGTGLGLYIVRNIVEKHQGSVDFKSVENKGTTFTITLPMRR